MVATSFSQPVTVVPSGVGHCPQVTQVPALRSRTCSPALPERMPWVRRSAPTMTAVAGMPVISALRVVARVVESRVRAPRMPWESSTMYPSRPTRGARARILARIWGVRSLLSMMAPMAPARLWAMEAMPWCWVTSTYAHGAGCTQAGSGGGPARAVRVWVSAQRSAA